MKKLILLLIFASAGAIAQFGLQSPGFVGQLSQKVSSSTTYTEQFGLTNASGANTRSFDSYGSYSTQNQATNVYAITRVDVFLYKVGSPTGNVKLFIYETVSPTADGANPDTRMSAGTTYDVSTLTTNTTAERVSFTFASAYTTTVDRYYQIVAWYGDGDASNYIVALGQAGTYDPGLLARRTSKTEPATSGDAGAWTAIDGNGYLLHQTYSSP